jgi:hypothetical protein
MTTFNDLSLEDCSWSYWLCRRSFVSVGQDVCRTSAAVKSESDIEIQTLISRPQAFEMTSEKLMPLGYASEKDSIASGTRMWRWRLDAVFLRAVMGVV